MADDGKLHGKLALITGATRGIGRAVALEFARQGAHLILLGRTSGALEEIDDEIRTATGATDRVTLITLNLRHGEKVDALGPTLFNRFGKLDILVGNAGVLGPLTPLAHVTNDAYAEVMDINVTANWRLIRTLDPLLQRADAGRAVFVSSGAAQAKNAYWGPYAVSKAALEALVKTYALEVASTRIKVNLINPGPIRTRMRAKAFPGEDAMTLKSPEEIAPSFLAFAGADCAHNGAIFDFQSGTIR